MARFDKLLVLDLDETLVHATTTPLRRAPDSRVGPYAVYKRPGVEAFLQRCLATFAEVGVWTASTLPYALPVLRRLLQPEYLAFVWGRERCTYKVDLATYEAVWLKDLKKLRRRGYGRRKVIFVDDSPEKFARSYGNLVTVSPFMGNCDDHELNHLSRYLEELGPMLNMRVVEKRGWQQKVQLVQEPGNGRATRGTSLVCNPVDE